MKKGKTSSNVLNSFRKEQGHNRIDKISIVSSKIGFLAGFIIQNNLCSFNYVNVLYNTKNRSLAFMFSNTNKKLENYKLKKNHGVHLRYCLLSKQMTNELNISDADYKKYSYTKHLEDGKEIYIIQLKKIT